MTADDSFTVRFHVEPVVWLDIEKSIPIKDDLCWQHLSFTRNLSPNDSRWTGMVRGSLRRLPDNDGNYLYRMLCDQNREQRPYPLSETEQRKYQSSIVNLPDRQVNTIIPETEDSTEEQVGIHSQIQATIARIGERMGMRIWIPTADRIKVFAEWQPESAATLLDLLPFDFNARVLRTIAQIDVIWIRRNTIVRVFEVEHTTAVYSGLLRMADLLAQLPNLNIKAHIVAPMERRNKVFKELLRPAFSLVYERPLYEMCTFMSYESVKELQREPNLAHMRDTILDELSEDARDLDA